MNDTTFFPGVMDFDLAFEHKYARVWSNPIRKIVICELLTDYVPIEDFKEVFAEIGDLVKEGDFTKFIFDKRALRAFHQPTMEWYFIHWKKEMLGYGLKTHRKILPAEKWFEKMVQIAKAQIITQYPDNIIDQLDIAYCDTLEAAILS
jgi:hypothetical protein